MHMLIRLVVPATNHEDALGLARSRVDYDGPLTAPKGMFDYASDMTEERARWSETMSRQLQENGAIEATTEEGQEIIEEGWELTRKEFGRYLAVLRKAFETLDDEAILEDTKVTADVETWHVYGLDPEGVDTYTSHTRYAMHQLGQYTGSSIYLYNEWGEGIRTQSEYDNFIAQIEQDANDPEADDWYVVPFDCHY